MSKVNGEVKIWSENTIEKREVSIEEIKERWDTAFPIDRQAHKDIQTLLFLLEKSQKDYEIEESIILSFSIACIKNCKKAESLLEKEKERVKELENENYQLNALSESLLLGKQLVEQQRDGVEDHLQKLVEKTEKEKERIEKLTIEISKFKTIEEWSHLGVGKAVEAEMCLLNHYFDLKNELEREKKRVVIWEKEAEAQKERGRIKELEELIKIQNEIITNSEIRINELEVSLIEVNKNWMEEYNKLKIQYALADPYRLSI